MWACASHLLPILLCSNGNKPHTVLYWISWVYSLKEPIYLLPHLSLLVLASHTLKSQGRLWWKKSFPLRFLGPTPRHRRCRGKPVTYQLPKNNQDWELQGPPSAMPWVSRSQTQGRIAFQNPSQSLPDQQLLRSFQTFSPLKLHWNHLGLAPCPQALYFSDLTLSSQVTFITFLLKYSHWL